MKVFLISANQERLPDPIPPIGLAHIAGAARSAGHEVRVQDLTFDEDFADALRANLQGFSPDVIGLSLRNIDNVAFPISVSYLPHYSRIVAICREVTPKTPLVLGGSAFSLLPEAFMELLRPEYGVVGEGENTFPRLLQRLEAGETEGLPRILYPEGTVDLDTTRPAWDLIDVRRYFQEGGSLNLQTKRGCPYKCGYCTYPALEGRKVRQTDPVEVVDRMEACLRDFGIDYFFFVDNVFNFPMAHSVAICEEIVRRELKVSWTAYVSPAHATEELFALYKKAGCTSVDFGSDAASESGLKSLSKSFGVQEVLDCSNWCLKHRLKFNHSIILGVPGETQETIEEAIDNMLRCKPTAVTAMIGVRIHKHTPLASQLIASGYLRDEEIGLEPVFYVEDSVRDYLLGRMEEMSRLHSNWIVPGLKKKMDEALFQKLRAHGLKGPLWKFLA